MKPVAGVSVLVVEDSDTIRRIIVSHVERMGFENVRQAIDGADAWKKISDEVPDLILSDWHMAPVDGYKLLRRVKSEKATSHVVFFMISTETNIELIQRAITNGCACFLNKPFKPDELKLKLSAFFQFS